MTWRVPKIIDVLWRIALLAMSIPAAAILCAFWMLSPVDEISDWLDDKVTQLLAYAWTRE